MNIAGIAAAALNGVQGAITDAVAAGTVSRTAQGAYNVTTGVYATTVTVQTGRVVEAAATAKPRGDIFPGYVVGPQDRLLFLEGFTGIRENDVVNWRGITATIRAKADIGGAGTVFYAMVR